jgi:hypothetical protein
MRFMMLMIPSVYQGGNGKIPGADFIPDAKAVEQMAKYNDELVRAGALISLDGLHSPATAARISFSKGRASVTDGPSAESKDVLGGYWMIQAKSREEAVQWAKRAPAADGDVIEIRQVFEMSDFPEDVQKAADSPTLRLQLDRNK